MHFIIPIINNYNHYSREYSIRRKTARSLLIKDYANSLTNTCLFFGND